MEVRKPHIKSIPYDEFKDNDTLEKITKELNEGGVNVIVGSLDQAINWGRSNSLWSLTFGTSCCLSRSMLLLLVGALLVVDHSRRAIT